MIFILSIMLWGSLASLGYSYVGYPLLIWGLSRMRGTQQLSANSANAESLRTDTPQLPSVTVLIAAHNAGVLIQDRIGNLLACDYPAESLRIVVASDGSTDDTVDLVRALQQPQVTVIPFGERRGKAATLVAALGQVVSEVVVFTDASTHFEVHALKRLAAHFRDPDMGIVAGVVSILDEQGRPAESLYWRSEMMVRRSEARLGLTMGASGAIYAMRRRHFVAPSRPIINDDLVFPILAHLKHRCGFTLDETAMGSVRCCSGWTNEFRRRCRIGAGGFQSLTILKDLFRPQHAAHAAAFVSHKLLRWICPFLLILALLCNIGLVAIPGYQHLLLIQSCAYLLALIGLFVPKRGAWTGIARAASSFLVMNIAILAGFFQWLADSNQATWNPTPRPALGSITQPRP